MVKHPDEAFKKLNDLTHKVFPKISESDTRAKYIDPLFTECLGWTEDDVVRETHVSQGYIDYVFSIDGIRKFVLEAKTLGYSFRVPDSQTSRRFKIGGSIASDAKIKLALEQAQKYCIKSGVKYGIITNGTQYIAFEAFRQGSDWTDGYCVAFRSFDDIREHFSLFWNTFSRQSVHNHSLRKYISEEELPLEFVIPRKRLHAQDSALARNNLSPILAPFIYHVFGTLTDDSQIEVLKDCYISKREFQDADAQIGRHFDRPPHFAEKYVPTLVLESEREAGDFQRQYESSAEFLRSTPDSGSMFMLMGGIGAGKTTFIHHFFKFIIGPRNKEALWFYVDFLKGPPNPDLIETFVYESVLEDASLKYPEIIRQIQSDLAKQGIGPLRPDLKDLVVLFSRLVFKGHTLALVLDNVDQQSYGSDKYQERTLLVANNLIAALRVVTILTLREESFFRSTMSGVLDASIPSVFHISFPSFEELVRSRIDYVLKLLRLPQDQLESAVAGTAAIGANRQMLSIYFEIIKNSLRSQRHVGREILRFIDEVSGGDMRAALHFFTSFLVSGNTDVAEMLSLDELDRKKNGPGYIIPFHHVIKSIILEDARLYSSSQSRIMNLFDLNSAHTNSHFTHLRILNYLNGRLGYSTTHGRGYVEIDEILQKGDEISIKQGAIEDSLKKMALFGLIEFENQSKQGFDEAVYTRITNMGMYYLKELLNMFPYLDLMWMDTPISNPDVVSKLLRNVVELRPYKSPSDLDDRFFRTEVFLDYLEDAEDDEFANNPELDDSPLTKRRFMKKIRESYEKQKEYITSKRTWNLPEQEADSGL